MKKWLLWGIPAALLLALVGWRFVAKGEADSQANRQQGAKRGTAASVEVATATSKEIVETIQAVGNVESPYKVEISPKSSGRINFLEVREGDPVKIGQLILKIDPSDLQGAYIQAQANVAEARSRLAQASITQGATNVGVTSQIKQQQAAVASAKADLNQVQNNLAAQVQTAQSQENAANSAVKNAQSSLTKEQANLRNAQIKYDRTVDLYKKGYIAAQDVDDAQTALDVEKGAVAVAQGEVDAAKSQLNVQQQNLSIVKRKGQSDIADSKAKVTQALATLDVASANRSQTPAYEANLAALRSSVDAAIAGEKQAQAKLSDTVIRSTIDGTVTARKADPGAQASPGNPVLEIQFLDWLYVTTTIPIEASTSVHEGQTAKITFDSLPGKTYSGPITNLNPAADELSRQFGVRIRLENPGHTIRPGMYARVVVETARVNAPVVVPREAITTNSSGVMSVAVVDKDNVAHVNQVKVGVSDDKIVEIKDGVKAGDKVVVLTSSPIRDGQKVTTGKPGSGAGGSGQGKRKGGRRGGAAGGAAGGGS